MERPSPRTPRPAVGGSIAPPLLLLTILLPGSRGGPSQCRCARRSSGASWEHETDKGQVSAAKLIVWSQECETVQNARRATEPGANLKGLRSTQVNTRPPQRL